MSIASILDERLGTWIRVLALFGYDVVAPDVVQIERDATFRLRATAMDVGPGPRPVVDVSEHWVDGAPEVARLTGTTAHGCVLMGASWHAQVVDGDAGAYRLDLDRTKHRPLVLHVHPFGAEGHVRQPLGHLPAIEQWVQTVEGMAISCLDEVD